jgi:hypothetical protein
MMEEGLTPMQWECVYVFMLAILKFNLFGMAARHGHERDYYAEVDVLSSKLQSLLT